MRYPGGLQKKTGISVLLVRNKQSARWMKASVGNQVFMSPALLVYKESLFLLLPDQSSMPVWVLFTGTRMYNTNKQSKHSSRSLSLPYNPVC
jgi:hypothetical protein